MCCVINLHPVIIFISLPGSRNQYGRKKPPSIQLHKVKNILHQKLERKKINTCCQHATSENILDLL